MSPGRTNVPIRDDAAFIQVAESLFADVRNVARELLAAQLRLADFDVEFLDVDRRVRVVLHQIFADDDRVFEVEAVPDHEARPARCVPGPVRP